MASTFSTNLAIELIGTGDQAGTWGVTTNTNLGTLIEQAISGYVTQAVATGTDTTITIPNGSTGVARNMYLELTGTGGTNTHLIVPSNKKLYFIFNNSTGAVTVKVSGQTGVSVPQGKKMVLVSNGTDIVNGLNYIADFGTNSFTVTNLTASSGTITNLIATTGTITTLSATSGNITNLVSSDASATVLRAGSATLTHLSATSASITNLALTSLTISSLSITNVSVASATVSSNLTLSGGTANGVLYLNGSKVATSGSAITYNGTTFGVDSAAVFNDSGADVDFRIEGDTDANLFFADASTDRIGIGTSSPGEKLTVAGSISTRSGNSVLFYRGDNTRFGSIYADNDGLNIRQPLNDNIIFEKNDGTNLALLDTSGNLGLGVTPSAFGSAYKAFQFGTTGALYGESGDAAVYLACNAFIDSGGANKYITSDFATRYNQENGVHKWLIAASGTAGNAITFTTAMTLDAFGNLGIGTSSPAYKLDVQSSSVTNVARLQNGTGASLYFYCNGSAASNSGVFGESGGQNGLSIVSQSNYITLQTNNAERARITSGGDFGIGTTSPSGRLHVATASGNCYVYSARASKSTGQVAFQLSGGTSGTDWIIYQPTNSDNLTFFGNSADRMTLDTSGNLGIGTTSPGEKLEVAGNIKSTGNSTTVTPSTNTQSASFISTNASGNFFHAIDNSTGAAFGAGAYGRVLYSGGAYPMAFFTNDAERARITSGGYSKFSSNGTYLSSTGSYHEFNQSANAEGLRVYTSDTSTYNSDTFKVDGGRATTNSTYNLANFRNGNGTGQCIIRDSGNIVNTNNSYGQISDIKTKQDVVDAASQWDDIKGVRVRKFRFKNDPAGLLQIGVVAQELEQVSPGLVNEAPDYEEAEVTDAEGNVTKERQPTGTTTKSVKYSVLYMKAIKALQEAMARIEKLEAEVAALKGA